MAALEKHMQIITANASPSAPHKTFTQFLVSFYCPNYKHTCNSFLPAPSFPQNQSDELKGRVTMM